MPSFKHERPTIGVLPGWSPMTGETPDKYLESVLKGIQIEARLKGCHLLFGWGLRPERIETNDLFPAWPVLGNDSDFVPVGPWNTDGLIVLAPLRHPDRSEYIEALIGQGFPVLFVASGENGPTITIDNEAGIQQAVGHFREHGHQRVAFIAGDPNDRGDSAARLRGYHAAVEKNGLAVDPGLVAQGWHTDPGGYLALNRLLESQVGFSAVVVSDDNSAIGAMRAIHAVGLKIPQDIAVIGFDDQPEAITQLPPLTSVHAPLRELGQSAGRVMFDHLTEGRPLESLLLGTHLVPRQSCGCLPNAVLSAGRPESPAARKRTNLKAAPERTAIQRLADEMTGSLPLESRFPEAGRTQALCNELIEAFIESVQGANAGRFQNALMGFLHQLELADFNVDLSQEVISVLRRGLGSPPLEWKQAARRRLAEDLLHMARVAISESAQRRDRRHQSGQEIRAHQLGILTSRLSATLDQQSIVNILNGDLTGVGIRHARVALFEADGADPVAFSVMPDHDPESPLHRFATREFPPPGLYPADEILNLALLPLLFQDEALGYVAFDGKDLSSCAAITRQVAVALKAASLHGQVIELSLTDPLTGLQNRRYFDLFLQNEVLRSQRFTRPLAIILLDVDSLKVYNDLYGHPAGDVALQKLAACLLEGRRNADVAARLGGDEFAIILPETDAAGAMQVARKIHSAVAALTGLMSPLTISIGVTALPAVQITPGVLVKKADQALYQAKRSGRDQTSMLLDEESS